jgi:tRNA A-37 threonylcarbamoyl transferase component Bud32
VAEVLTTGQLLAERYRLVRRIAVGGMGEVWEAADTRLDRAVAVKVLKPELCGDAEFLHRFRVEARTTASLNHPGVAAVHDYGETAALPDGPKDTAYLVMELVEGDPLAAILAREGRLGVDRTLDILEQAGNALQAAHERGYVHRDVKPGNILVTPTGKVKITDFGIAKAADATPVTHRGMVMGTAHYIAPEQATGHAAEPASDVYALAVVGYECLAGRRPFLNENAVTVAMMHIRDVPPPLPPDVPPTVRALIEATLAKDPRQRYRSGGEFAAAVAAVRAGYPLPVPSSLAPLAPRRAGMATAPSFPPVPVQAVPMQTLPPGVPDPGQPTLITPPPPGFQRMRARRRVWPWLLALFLVVLVVSTVVILVLAGRTGGSAGNGIAPATATTPVRESKPAFPTISGRPPFESSANLDADEFVGRPADEMLDRLIRLRMRPQVDGNHAVSELGRCVVTRIDPTGQVPVNSVVTVWCTPQ